MLSSLTDHLKEVSHFLVIELYQEPFIYDQKHGLDMFLNQIVLVGGIPFSVTLPNAPESIDMTKMSENQIHAKIQRGYESYKAGRTQNVAEAFNRFRESHS